MAKRKQPSAIGLSMLDLISNSLAAVIILFIIISSLRIPFIPPERVKGTLFIRYELIAKIQPDSAQSEIWLNPPTIHNRRERFWEGNISLVNQKYFGVFPDCGGIGKKPRNHKNYIMPCAMVYSPVDSANVHYLIIRQPIKGEWKTGILYKDHLTITEGVREAKAKIDAWFVGKEVPGFLPEKTDITLIASTSSLDLTFNTPEW